MQAVIPWVVGVGLIAVLGVMAGAGGADEPQPVAAQPERAMWVWSSARGRQAVTDAKAREALFDFCEAPHGRTSARISRLWVETHGQEGWSEFLRGAHARGISVEYLVGKGHFGSSDVGWLKEMCDRIIVEYNPSAPPEERWDGLHFDIEPGEQQPWSQRALRELLAHARRQVDRYHAAQPHRMTLSADIGFWWAEDGEDTTPQYPDVVEFCDYIVCMAYRDTAEAQLEVALVNRQPEAAKRRGLPYWIGCETQELPGEPFVTYYEEGWKYMEAELAKLPELFAARGLRLGGIAIHHLDSYLDMTAGPRPTAEEADAGEEDQPG